MKYRQYTKLNSTYVDGLLKTIASDGRIHTCFKQTETRTGRISSTEPNMQNIPVRTELGSRMRKFFIADDNKVLLDADYSQIELRVMAHLCGDENMISAFTNNEDIHTSTAAQVFDMPKEMVTPEMRSAAKAVNFGIIYGIGAFSLSKDINVSVYKAKKYIEDYLSKYPKVKQFMDNTVKSAEATGFVSTMFIGKDDSGRYNFADKGLFTLSKEFIERGKVSIDKDFNGDEAFEIYSKVRQEQKKNAIKNQNKIKSRDAR